MFFRDCIREIRPRISSPIQYFKTAHDETAIFQVLGCNKFSQSHESTIFMSFLNEFSFSAILFTHYTTAKRRYLRTHVFSFFDRELITDHLYLTDEEENC